MGYISPSEMERLRLWHEVANSLRQNGGEAAVKRVFPEQFKPTENERRRRTRKPKRIVLA